jgi:sulfopyruvate decarboxylase TPP-binding subunit|tara:strand:- start:1357 stop:1752 length:396 start_codon:yes stop_codon:yes gene_type:complete
MIDNLFQKLVSEGYNFFTGVPDSALKVFQNNIIESDFEHVIATNEGQAVGIAFGAEVAGKKSCVYLQNSGLGNIINPITSLCMPFEIKPLLVIGHRHTLEQHKVMGETDEKILQTIGYQNYIIVKGENNVK